MKTLIIGVGLIGGSFALALRRHMLSDEIWGVETSPENAAEALSLGLVDRIVALDEGLPSADLIVLAVPVDAAPLLAVKILNRIGARQTVMDTGSIKEELCDVVSQHPMRSRFVATHPMWGTEYSGPSAARNDAFAGRTVVILERERTASDALALVERIYETIGMHRIYMDSGEEHDLHAAYVSHISHITSFALALTVLEKERVEQHIFDLAGGGFESTVRLAKSSADTWIPIFLKNKYNVLDVLREHIHQLQVLRKMIEADDADGLAESIRRANTIRRIIK
ncbi:MAG: prephenate dehydrogenase [Alistipes sp.]|nr:prephenate dehydrogenase [Alistipes sp.]